MGVTEITDIENHADKGILAWNWENSQHQLYYEIPPKNPDTGHPGHVSLNWWIPWCTSEQDFANRHFISIYGGIWADFPNDVGIPFVFNIWQRDFNWVDKVRWTNKRYWDPGAHPMPGDSYVNGTRTLKIYGLDGDATQDNNARAELMD